MSGGRVVFLDQAASTVTVFPTSITDDGAESATITVRLVNTDGNPMPGLPVTLSSTGSGNTITQPVGVTNQDGEITGSIVSTVAVTKTLSAVAMGATLTDTASLSVQVTGGTVATFTDISRDASNTAGGDLVLLTVSTISGTPAVRFDGILADDITVVNATTISCRVPANPSVGPCDVVCGGVELVNPRASIIGGDFEYLPVASTTFVDADFESGSIPASMAAANGTGAVTVQSSIKYSGTYAAQMSLTGAEVGGDECYLRNATNIDIAGQANGVYLRFYQRTPASTVTNLGQQIKSHLFRRQAGSGQPGWIMMGIGSDFGSANFTSFLDNGIVDITGGESVYAGSDDWLEILMWHYWDAGASEGRVRQWLNGKIQYDVQDAVLGGNGADYRFRVGIGYIFNRTDDCVMYIDEVFCGNGFPNAVEV